MAHAATIGELAGSLITSITGFPNDHNLFRSLKDRTVRGLKDSSRRRTNPFEVNDRFSGLIEKFAVRNRDDLAGEIKSRLDSLPKAKWTPEILSLLLQLSDRPLENTHIRDLDLLTSPLSPPSEPTWEEIVAEDPLTDSDIWDDVDREYHSSGDDALFDDELNSEPTTSTQATSYSEEDFAALARLHVVRPDADLILDVRSAKQALSASGKSNGAGRVLSELIIIRETLSMLHGLPTHLFDVDPHNGAVTVNNGFTIATMTIVVLQHVLARFAEIGRRLNFLRRWTSTEQRKAHMQSIQATVQQSMKIFTLRIGALEQRLVRSQDGCIVSLVDLRTEMEALARPMVRLSEIITDEASIDVVGRSPFALLNLLYDEACIAHLAGDDELFAVVGQAMLAGLRTYLLPVLSWSLSGTLPSKDAEDFFVRQHEKECELGEMWHKRYALRPLPDGSVCAPDMIQPFVEQVYALGKSKAFSKLLGVQSEDETAGSTNVHKALDIISINQCLKSSPLIPFDELIRASLADCMATLSPTTGLSVPTFLLDGLLRTIHALAHVFLSRDGMLLQAYAELLFDRIRRDPETWNDSFILTRLAQSTLGAAPNVDAHCIDVDVPSRSNLTLPGSPLRRLDHLELTYAISWPVQNVTRSRDLPTYTAAFGLLMQLECAAHLLRLQLFNLRKLESSCRHLARGLQMALGLRTRLLWFVSTLRAHIATTAAVLASELAVQLKAAEGIDTMAEIWASHDKRLQASLLLTPKLAPIRDAITSILRLCESLADAWSLLLDSDASSEAVAGMTATFNKSLSFISAGLRGVSRAGGEPALEALSERLQWSGG
ncbi:hypothetical protein B0A55_10568 [Friedmanniomyces simplex]|uniref:Spindle pole body component n=1 Tax=Friedmanniomyces simplex TaxID=329884 RepID=A0A4U0WRC4_9PEZI|nr:hypothetical protein B0A55_10568 [Friedmanniomyces simplex]